MFLLKITKLIVIIIMLKLNSSLFLKYFFLIFVCKYVLKLNFFIILLN